MYNQAGAAAAAADMGRNGGLPSGLPGLPGLPADLMGSMGHHAAADKFAEQRQRMFEAAAAAARDESDDDEKCNDDVDITEKHHDNDVTSDKDTDDEHVSRHRAPPPPTPPEIRASRAEILDGEEDIEDLEGEEEDLDEPVGNGNNDFSLSSSPPPPASKKRRRSEDMEDDPNLEMTAPRKITAGSLGIPGANIKISSRGKNDIFKKIKTRWHVLNSSNNYNLVTNKI